jgi:hypothetical protein
MPIGLPAFPWMVRIAAPVLRQTQNSLLMDGTWFRGDVVEMRFEFKFPKLTETLVDLPARKPTT